jgi:radical SAM modification target selenobiotic family peptide
MDLTLPSIFDTYFQQAEAKILMSVSSLPMSNSILAFPSPGEFLFTFNQTGGTMDAKDLKKILAGLCIAGLISGSAFTLNSCAGNSSENQETGSSQTG